MLNRSFHYILLGLLGAWFSSAWAADTVYVSLDGTHVEPYNTWETAATNIQTAVDYASAHTDSYDTVLVSNGFYYASNSITPTLGIQITAALTVKGLAGREATIVSGTNLPAPIFIVSNANAVVEGFTITGGRNIGVKMWNGIVSNCIVSSNHSGARSGGCDFMTANAKVFDSIICYNSAQNIGAAGAGGSAGTLTRCVIVSNKAADSCGGLAGVKAYNCLIAYNMCENKVAGANGATLVNCTVVSNRVTRQRAAYQVDGLYGCTLTNCIVAYNGVSDFVACTSSYSCSPIRQPGEGNIGADPQFVDLANSDFRLQFGSPAIDAGTNLAHITDDLDGNPRPLNGNNLGLFHDMGCYEAPDYGTGPLSCRLTVTPAAGWEAVTATCQAILGGADRDINHYWWDFGDGTLQDGASLSTATHTFGPGRYDITLTVSNSLGAVASHKLVDAVMVGVATSYVAEGGTGSFPYASWEEAAGNIQDAVLAAEAGSAGGAPNPCVLVSNGVYALIEPITISKGVRVEGVAGRDETLLRRASLTTNANNIFNIYHPEAVLSGLTIANATNGPGVYMVGGIIENCTIVSNNNLGAGGGVYMVSGLITNCIIAANKAEKNSDAGGGIYMLGGEVIDSVISNNYTPRSGGGVYITNGLLLRCHIVDNQAPGGSSNGGGVWADYPATLRNCLIANNVSYYVGSAIAGHSSRQSTLINCTVVSNHVIHSGTHRAGISGCYLTNCIVYSNTWSTTNGVVMNSVQCAGSYNCTTAPDLVGSGNISDDPQFIDWAGGDYRLSASSPARRAGTTNGIIDTVDLVGAKRISGGLIDMGAYQSMPPAGTIYSFY